MNTWFRIAGTGVACLMLLMLAVRASTCITGERERDTFDALLTTPLSCEAMLAGKLLGCLTSLRMGWLWFGSMLAIALLTRGLHLLAVPIVIGSWFVYAVFFTMVGMWFSMACQSSLRATVLAVLTTLFLGGGHWLMMGLCCLIPSMIFMRHGNPEDFVRYIAQFELGMTPPFVLQHFSYSWQGLGQRVGPDSVEVQMFYFSLIGVFLWALACVFLWHGVLVPKFRELSRREELIYQ
jgi:ABC-type transport system involved in multi-copper enzyme maturation permease subunit